MHAYNRHSTKLLQRIDPTVFIDVCFLEVLPQIGSVMNVAEDTVTNLAIDLLPFPLVQFQNFAISSRETKKLPNSTNSSFKWQKLLDRVNTWTTTSRHFSYIGLMCMRVTSLS